MQQIEDLKKPGLTKFTFDKIPFFSAIDKAYSLQPETLKELIRYPPLLESFPDIIADKKSEACERNLLINDLKKQYERIPGTTVAQGKVLQELKSENCFTIITAHQPCLFLGPLYVIYKCISAINLSQRLNREFPEYKFLPVFIVGGEDHDFDEISSCSVFGNHIRWESDNIDGPVGRMKTENLYSSLKDLEEILGESPFAKKAYQKLQDAYQNTDSFAAGTQALLLDLFQETKLIVASMDTAAMKRSFIPYMEKEILEGLSRPVVHESQALKAELGYDSQAHVRDINFFYIPGNEAGENRGKRLRIVKEEEAFQVLGTELQFTEEEMREEIHNSPERFSPNVVMRPLYQEFIFPNLAYIGGGGELSYWLERKKQFEAFEIDFPMLLRRDSCILIDEYAGVKMNKLGLSLQELMLPVEELKKSFVLENSEIDLNLEKEKAQIREIFEEIAAKSNTIDEGIIEHVASRETEMIKILDHLEKKIIKSGKKRHRDSLEQLSRLRESLFPENGLQERTDNFLSFYARYGEQWIQDLLDHLDPMDKTVKVFRFK